MKKTLISLAICLIATLFFPSCAEKPADDFSFMTKQMSGDKYFVRLELTIRQKGQEPFKRRENSESVKEISFECSSNDADISYSGTVLYKDNSATAYLDVGYSGVLSGMSDTIGLNGKTVKIVFNKLTVNGVEHIGDWTLEHTVQVPTASKHYYLNYHNTKNNLRFLNIEAASNSIIYCAEVNDLPREYTGRVTFYSKDGGELSGHSSSFSAGWEDDSNKSEISGVLEFPSGIDMNDIGFIEFDGERYELSETGKGADTAV